MKENENTNVHCVKVLKFYCYQIVFFVTKSMYKVKNEKRPKSDLLLKERTLKEINFSHPVWSSPSP